jgi:hypothetical protein
MLRCACDEEEERSIAFQRSDNGEEEERGEEEQHGEEAENVGRGPMTMMRVRRLSLSVCRGRLGGATWLLLLLRPHEKRIEFLSGHWMIGKYIFDLFIVFQFLVRHQFYWKRSP